MIDQQQQLERIRATTWSTIEEDPKLERVVRALYYFYSTILMTGPNFPVEVTGCHFSQRGLNTLLVVKANVEGTPQVAFVTEKFPTGCVVTFCRQWLEDRVKWHLDKYAKT